MIDRLFSLVLGSWRSVASAVLAYAIIALLFFYDDGMLARLFDVASKSHDEFKDLVGHWSKRGEFLFGFTISEGSVFVTMMILFVRIFVLSIILWIAGLIVEGVFGKAPARRS